MRPRDGGALIITFDVFDQLAKLLQRERERGERTRCDETRDDRRGRPRSARGRCIAPATAGGTKGAGDARRQCQGPGRPRRPSTSTCAAPASPASPASPAPRQVDLEELIELKRGGR